MSAHDSPRILKANAIRGLGSKVVFDYGDLRRQCDEYVDRARRQAEQILSAARGDSVEIRRRAEADGREQGLRRGMENADREIERRAARMADDKALEKLKTTFPALQAAAEALVQERERWLAHWASTAVGLSVAVAEKLLRREIDLKPEIAVDLLRETLELAAGSPRLQLRMHSDDVELLGAHAEEVVRSISGCGEVEITSDDSITRGGCVIETRHGTIDARLETGLQRIASELIEQS